MFDTALTTTVSLVMIIGIVIMLLALRTLKEGTRKLRQKNIARGRSHSYDSN